MLCGGFDSDSDGLMQYPTLFQKYGSFENYKSIQLKGTSPSFLIFVKKENTIIKTAIARLR